MDYILKVADGARTDLMTQNLRRSTPPCLFSTLQPSTRRRVQMLKKCQALITVQSISIQGGLTSISFSESGSLAKALVLTNGS